MGGDSWKPNEFFENLFIWKVRKFQLCSSRRSWDILESLPGGGGHNVPPPPALNRVKGDYSHHTPHSGRYGYIRTTAFKGLKVQSLSTLTTGAAVNACDGLDERHDQREQLAQALVSKPGSHRHRFYNRREEVFLTVVTMQCAMRAWIRSEACSGTDSRETAVASHPAALRLLWQHVNAVSASCELSKSSSHSYKRVEVVVLTTEVRQGFVCYQVDKDMGKVLLSHLIATS